MEFSIEPLYLFININIMSIANEMEVISLSNPTQNDFTFHWAKEPYTVPAMGSKLFPRFIAEHGAMHLAKRIMIDGGKYQDKIQGTERVPSLILATDFLDIEKKLIQNSDAIADIASDLNLTPVVEDENKGEIVYTEESLNEMNFTKLKSLASKFEGFEQSMKKPELVALILAK